MSWSVHIQASISKNCHPFDRAEMFTDDLIVGVRSKGSALRFTEKIRGRFSTASSTSRNQRR